MKNLLSWTIISLLLSWVTIPGTVHANGESNLTETQAEYDSFLDQLNSVDRVRIRRSSSRTRPRLSPQLRKKYDEFSKLRKQLTYWTNVVSLKKDLLALPSADTFTDPPSPEKIREAEAIASTAITAFGELKAKYKVGDSALLHNLAIQLGLKKEGYCWHWTRDIRKRLKALHLEKFDLYWATSREGTFREHNTVVLVSKGRPFTEGILLDGWRMEGKPFWIKVTADRKNIWKLNDCQTCTW